MSLMNNARGRFTLAIMLCNRHVSLLRDVCFPAVLGEMWIAVVVTICVELTPRSMHAATVSIFMFISVNIGECVRRRLSACVCM